MSSENYGFLGWLNSMGTTRDIHDKLKNIQYNEAKKSLLPYCSNFTKSPIIDIFDRMAHKNNHSDGCRIIFIFT